MIERLLIEQEFKDTWFLKIQKHVVHRKGRIFNEELFLLQLNVLFGVLRLFADIQWSYKEIYAYQAASSCGENVWALIKKSMKNESNFLTMQML